MKNKILNLNYFYIVSTVFFITLIIFGFNDNSYLFSSGIEIIILCLIFIFAVLNTPNENIFLKFYIFYFYVFYLINIFVICLPGYDSYFIQKDGSIFSVNKSINTLSIHFFSIFILIRLIFENNTNKLLNTINNHNLSYLIFSCFILTFFSMLSFYLIYFSISTSPIFKIISVVYAFDKILLIFVTLLYFFWNKIDIRLKVVILFAIIFFILFDFASGSKSSIFFLFLVIIFCFFYLDNKNLISIRLIVVFLTLLIFSLITFFFAVNSLVEIHKTEDLLAFFYSFFNRIGFFEFYLDKNNSSSYNEVMNLKYNLKAFLDKITPGFDLYGIPLMKNQLHYLWHYHENLLYTGVVSEQSTLFAVSNRVFHYYFILYYILIILFFKFLYKKTFFLESEKQVISHISILYLFYTWLNGFGIDYFLMIVIYQIIFLFSIFSISFALKKIFK